MERAPPGLWMGGLRDTWCISRVSKARLNTTHIPSASRGSPCVRPTKACSRGSSGAGQEVHLEKSSPAMEADLRKCGEDIKRGLRQSMDRTHRSPCQQIQCGGGWRVNKSTTQKSCSPSHHRGPRYSTASCGAASRFCRVRRACSSRRHGAAQEFTLTNLHKYVHRALDRTPASG